MALRGKKMIDCNKVLFFCFSTLSQSLNQDGPNVGEKDFHEKILEIVGSSERKGRAFMKTSVLTAAADLATNLAGAFEKSVADEEGGWRPRRKEEASEASSDKTSHTGSPEAE